MAKEDGLLKCAYCSTRYTAMWQPGPAGHGTLCNSCGIQWKRKEILKGAPVISPHEEKRLLREKKEKERLNELIELEKEQMKKAPPKKLEDIPLLKKNTTKKTKGESSITKKAEDTVVTTPLVAAAAAVAMSTTTAATSTTTTTATTTTAATTSNNNNTNSFFLYSQGGIPLPTLSIAFGSTVTFLHPNCAVTLLDGHFHIRLCMGEQSLINLEKSDLENAHFEISTQEATGEDASTGPREILTMILSPLSRTIQIGQFSCPPQPITIQFLEKIDPSGGAVVKRILQRWLVTVPQ